MSNNFRYRFFPTMAAAAVTLLLGGCAKDTLPEPGKDSDVISFQVSQNNFDSDYSTRSLEKPTVKTVHLSGAEKPLFLVPRVEDYISRNTAAEKASDIKATTAKASTGSATRSELVNESTIQDFGVFAGYADHAGTADYDPRYMNNVLTTRESGWIPEGLYLWPGSGALHFNAYSPFYQGDVDVENADQGIADKEGITSLSINAGNITLSYSTPQEIANQKELLVAAPVDASASPVNLNFQHALTGIRFAAGSELAPCTIKNISISGVNSNGQLNLETGEWTDLGNPLTFSQTLDLALTAAEGSKYVEAGTPITSASSVFLLIPQSFGADAGIQIVADFNGKETTLSAPLTDQTWTRGKLITYLISANPNADSLILDVSGDINTEYTGSPFTFSVKSTLDKDGESTPIRWKAEFVDDQGNVISKPDWIESMTMNGDGDTDGTGRTVMHDILFDKMSAHTRVLQDATDINTTSGNTPYNLASSTGSSSVENTANSYIINAPGTYSLPLVYGNAIKNGATNSAAYTISTHQKDFLKEFTNHLGNAITSPYIYSNTGCTPSEAVLIWEDELNLVRNVRLSSDTKSIVFDIPHNTIRQGNAMVAVKDGDGKVMWSWQLWITDFNPAEGTRDVNVDGTVYGIWEENLGYVESGDVIRFPESSVKIRFTQTGVPDDLEPLSKTITLTQSGAVIANSDYNPYYQWGRKDPMMSDVQQWYDGSNKEIKVLPTSPASSVATSQLLEAFIQHPDIFYLASHDVGESGASNADPYPYKNLWDIGQNAKDVKTIYDPSPVGYLIPYSQPLMYMSKSATITQKASQNNPDRTGYYVELADEKDPLFFPAMGYRHSTGGGDVVGDNLTATYWCSRASNIREAERFIFSEYQGKSTLQAGQFAMFMAFSVRPVREN